MSGPFEGKRFALGVSGSIAAYKVVDLASKLTQAGAAVDVLMSYGATRFVTPLTFRSITHRPVITDIFDVNSPDAVEHVAIAKSADILVVAPATAHTIAKLALGMADDPISITALATAAPLVVAPAMDANMWDHPAVRANAETLQKRGARIVGPGKGRLASGLEGWGRLAETAEIMGVMAAALGANGSLAGRTIVVSAGGTQEPIDPVRVVSNNSSGKMGYAIAEAARDRGARVVLVAAPTALADPPGVETVHVKTANEMYDAVLAACQNANAVIMAAAVADYAPAIPASQKLKKDGADSLLINLVRTRDILAATPRNLVRVGFAAESTDVIEYAKSKLISKGLDLIVANDITLAGAGFGSNDNKVTLVDSTG
ncbi:MAG: bifunctional phosphopantothenoylcysteine decarboxylase/phosphopantothenate--cysteine ligase CoaBC, partial [Chloroflexi bacterium]|nr:bifunctional phosphopantothenoylcysteine decarboxylase/phosphopantothenate--cysteine ligase CoaBC [Chloroflexota bacterium]